ncbi:MAG TPA: hypothetical protein VIV60_02900, partial [Polyangiaceae bacterium]
VRPSADNAPRVLAALAAFGAPLHDLCEAEATIQAQTKELAFAAEASAVWADELTGEIATRTWTRRLATSQDLRGLAARGHSARACPFRAPNWPTRSKPRVNATEFIGPGSSTDEAV